MITMSDTGRQYKIARVAEKYGLTDIEDELVKQWSRDEDAMSLRDLADLFNRRVLRAVMEDANMNPLDGEVENTYRLLTDNDVSSGVRTEVRKKLQRNDVDVDELEANFVTYQSVRTYLREGRDVKYERVSDTERIENVRQTVRQLQNRTVTVTEEKLSQLNQTNRIDLGEFRVLLDARIFCEDCGTQYNVDEVLDQAGCECGSDTPAEE